MKKKKLKSITQLKNRLDKLVKDFVKKRDNYTCQHCGKQLEPSNCHGSHVVPVSGGNQFRFDPINIKTLCWHCHLSWWHKNPVEASNWFKNKFPDRYEYLFGKPRQTKKFTIDELEALILKYS